MKKILSPLSAAILLAFASSAMAGGPAVITVTQSAASCGQVAVGGSGNCELVTISRSNAGGGTFISFAPPLDSANFTIIANTCEILYAGESCDLLVRATPTVAGPLTTTVEATFTSSTSTPGATIPFSVNIGTVTPPDPGTPLPSATGNYRLKVPLTPKPAGQTLG